MHHFDLSCALCIELRDVHARAVASLSGPVTHVHIAGYARWAAQRLELHVTCRHDPRSHAIACGRAEATALDREDACTMSILREITRTLDRFDAAIAAETETAS